MLTQMPVSAAPVPRVHIGHRQPGGTLRVFDRPTGRHLMIYSPMHANQFASGHKAGLWYVRPANQSAAEPQGPGFASAQAAIEAVNSGRWSHQAQRSPQTFRALRVIWESAIEPSTGADTTAGMARGA
jgi:hypothetical protein